jgi:AraC-like DNA-binding protein
MTMTAELLASGEGWAAHDIVCTAGPNDRPYEERHDWMCVAMVTEGTFQYRTDLGTVTLVPGALLLGNAGRCFQCGHEHGIGDRCISFHFSPAMFEEVAAAMPGIRRLGFAVPGLAPSERHLPLVAAAEDARTDPAGLEEVALWIAAAAAAGAAGAVMTQRPPSARDRRRVTDALRRIEARSHESFTLTALAADAAMSPYHFLRTFRAVAGVTPHQFTLAQRLRGAARALRGSDRSVAAIAYDAGFGDLSTFNRRFRKVMGVTPTVYRQRRAASRPAPRSRGQKCPVSKA